MSILSILLEITVYSALIFCFVMLFKKVFGKHLSPSLHYFIWLLLVVRLIMPITIDSGFNLFSIPADSLPVNVYVHPPAADTAHIDSPIPNENIDKAPHNTAASVANRSSAVQPTVSAEPATTTPFNWRALLLYIWIAGVALSVLYLFWSYLYLKKRIGKSAVFADKGLSDIFQQCIRELGIKRNIRMVLQNEIGSPALLVFPVMLMPVDMMQTMNKQQVAFAIKHELMHYKRKDHIACLLLSLLQAVYWFNPFVWLAYRQIRRDMETACDSMVVKTMDSAEKLKYATTVLSLFSRKKQLPVMLGMAVINTKKAAEKRIKGIYMKQKSNPKGRLATAVLACVMIITCFTTACQPTPEDPIVIGKGDDALESAIAATALPESTPIVSEEKTEETSPTNMVLSEHWQDTLSENNVAVNIDADVYVPNVSSYPVYEVAPYFTDEALARKFMSVLAKDATEVHNGAFSPPEDYERTILSLKKERAELEAGKTGDDSITPIKDQIASIDEQLKQVEQEYAESKKESDLVGQPLDFSFEGSHSQLFLDTDTVKERILHFTATMKDGSTRMLGFQNTQESTVQHTILYCFNPQAKRSNEAGLLPSTQEAVSVAMAIINELDIGVFDFKEERLEYAVDENTGQSMDEPNAKQLIFSKIYNGIPVNQYNGASNPACVPEDELVYNVVLRQEEIDVTFSQDGMIGFSWDTPCNVLRTENENVAVISFDEAKDIFNQQVMFSIYPWDDRETKIDIDEVRLGYMVIPVKDDLSAFRTIPVWDFIGADNSFGDEKYHHFDNQRSFVTINAIDGSVIDRNLGY